VELPVEKVYDSSNMRVPIREKVAYVGASIGEMVVNVEAHLRGMD